MLAGLWLFYHPMSDLIVLPRPLKIVLSLSFFHSTIWQWLLFPAWTLKNTLHNFQTAVFRNDITFLSSGYSSFGDVVLRLHSLRWLALRDRPACWWLSGCPAIFHHCWHCCHCSGWSKHGADGNRKHVYLDGCFPAVRKGAQRSWVASWLFGRDACRVIA